MSTPQSQIYICSGVRLDNRQQHTIHFRTLAEQREFFAGKVVKTFSAYSYHRRKWKLKVATSMDQAQQWNYLYIVQPGSPDYQYYFINAVNYLSDSTVELDLELDVMQTYMVNGYSLLPCFIERTHVTDDTPGAHTIPEGLEMGQYYNYHQYDAIKLEDLGILVLSAIKVEPPYEWNGESKNVKPAGSHMYSGVFSGLTVYAFADVSSLSTLLQALDDFGKSDAIVAIWMYPKKLVSMDKTWDEISGTDGSFKFATVTGVVNDNSVMTMNLASYNNYKANMFGGYGNSVKNNKLFAYPYNMLYCTNNAGGTAEYRFEDFAGDPSFRFFAGLGADATVKMCPDRYNQASGEVNYDEGLAVGAYPNCAWNSDTYKVWLAQNYNQLNNAMVGGALTIASGVATAAFSGGNPATIAGGAITAVGGISQITGVMAQKKDAQAQPPQAKGAFSTAVNVTAGKQTFSFYYKSIRKEYAQQLDDFFTMYGYKINRVMTPNLRARKAFTFVKTVGCKITGALSNEDMTAIQTIFDNGVTFWTDPNKVGDYTQDNTL